MENVPGLANDPRFEALLARLRKAGYRVRWGVLDAADYGVPQRRRRLILTAGLGGEVQFPLPKQRSPSVRSVFKRLPPTGQSGDPWHDHLEVRSARVRALIEKIPKDGGGRLDLCTADQLPCHQALDGFRDVYGRIAWDEVAPTITSGFINPSKGRFLHPEENRAITVREGAVLQSFPRNYKFTVAAGKYPVATLIGNAVPPRLAKAQALAVRRFLSERLGLAGK